MTMAGPAEARGGHGVHDGFGEHGMRGGKFAGDRRHSDDEHMKVVLEEDKLPNSRIKSICRGCQANRGVSAHQVANPKRGC